MNPRNRNPHVDPHVDPHIDRHIEQRRPAAEPDAFKQFQASALFCGHCKCAQPVRERLLLVLPDGELHEYLCAACGTSVGSRKVTNPAPVLVGR